MNLPRLLLFLTIVAGVLRFSCSAFTEELNTNYFAAVNREVDLVRSIFDETNSVFDSELCASLQIQSTQSVEIRYLQVALFVFYPSTNAVGPSYCETAIPYRLVSERGRIARVETATNEIPMNYVRVFDPTKSQVTADLRVFVAAEQSGRADKVRYLHRSFQFTYRQGWKLSENPHREGEARVKP